MDELNGEFQPKKTELNNNRKSVPSYVNRLSQEAIYPPQWIQNSCNRENNSVKTAQRISTRNKIHLHLLELIQSFKLVVTNVCDAVGRDIATKKRQQIESLLQSSIQ